MMLNVTSTSNTAPSSGNIIFLLLLVAITFSTTKSFTIELGTMSLANSQSELSHEN